MTTGPPGDDRRRPGQADWADALVTAFGAWAAEHRAGAAAEARSRERWLRQQVAETATLAGTLVDLAEQGADAAVIVGPRRVTGRLIGVGGDGCVVADRAGAVTIVALAHVSAVRVAGRRPGTGEATGARPPAGAWDVADAMAALAAERSPVRISLRGGETLSGDLISVGDDVLTVRLAEGGMRVYVALGALETCSPL
jgi:hypothetical protein